jgi:hypothetical protein
MTTLQEPGEGGSNCVPDSSTDPQLENGLEESDTEPKEGDPVTAQEAGEAADAAADPDDTKDAFMEAWEELVNGGYTEPSDEEKDGLWLSPTGGMGEVVGPYAGVGGPRNKGPFYGGGAGILPGAGGFGFGATGGYCWGQSRIGGRITYPIDEEFTAEAFYAYDMWKLYGLPGGLGLTLTPDALSGGVTQSLGWGGLELTIGGVIVTLGDDTGGGGGSPGPPGETYIRLGWQM